MKKYIVLTFALLCSVISNVSAQIIDVVDDFSDGDFVSSPSWKGDTADFMVYDLQLRLNGSKADTSYLSSTLRLMPTDTLKYGFWLKHNSLTSNNSYFRFYFYADNVNPEYSTEALFLEIKPRTIAQVAVCKQYADGEIVTLIEQPYKLSPTNAGQMRFKVLRYPDGRWQLDVDTSGGVAFRTLLSFVDLANDVLVSECYISLWCKYTSADKNKFFIDDIEATAFARSQDGNEDSIMRSAIMPNDLLINEVLFNPYLGGDDFVEIYNNTDSIVVLNKLCLATWDEVGDHVKTLIPLPGNAVVHPRDYVVISSNIDFLRTNYDVKFPDKMYAISKMPSYPNISGSVMLVLSDSTIIDRFDYNEDMHYRWLNDVEGVSLERRSLQHPTDMEDNWHSAAKSVGWATPTYRNSQAADILVPDDAFIVDPDVFSPDNDGYNDLLNISYATRQGDLLANVYIFDQRGRLVKTLHQNALLGTNGMMIWDGSADDGNRCRMGNYVVKIEVFDTSGSVQTIKKVVAIMMK